MKADGLDQPLDVPGAHPALQEISEHRFELLANFLLSPPAISDNDPNRVVTRPWYASFLREATDATPCLGDRMVSIVEASGSLAKTGIEARRHRRHRAMLAEDVASVRLGASRKSAKSSSPVVTNPL